MVARTAHVPREAGLIVSLVMSCEICGKEPAVEVAMGKLLCTDCEARYRVWPCRSCGARTVSLRKLGDLGLDCRTCIAVGRLAQLPAALLERVDAKLRDGRTIDVLMLLREEMKPRPDLGDAQMIAEMRARALGVPARKIPTPPTLEQLIAGARALGPNVAAIEATWDGDTTGWFVRLVAVVRVAEGVHGFDERALGVFVEAQGDMRLFRGGVPPWPEAVLAQHLGAAAAQELGVPFFFGSPDAPDLDAPRWWDLQPQVGSARKTGV